MRVALPVLTLALLVGCAGAARTGDAPEGAEYPTALQARADAAASRDGFVIRHNPVPCGCPAFEIALGDHWDRVAVEVDAGGADAEALQATLGAPSTDPLVRWELEGSLDTTLRLCGQGALYVTLRATRVKGAQRPDRRPPPRGPPQGPPP